MSEKKPDMCPYFPDMPCPQGKESADACLERVSDDFDPMTGFRDYQIMDCAIKRARQNEEKGER